jgi:subfamily B ATP-binding cassette protein HlyB/CyaB
MAGVLLFSRTCPRRQTHLGSQRIAAHSILLQAIEFQGTIKAAVAEHQMCGKFGETMAAELTGVWTGLSLTSAGVLLVNVVTLWMGSAFVLTERMTLGQLMAVQSLIAVAAVPVFMWSILSPQLFTLADALYKLAEVCEIPREREFFRRSGNGKAIAAPPPSVRGHLCFENVSFRYHPETAKVLSRINLDLRPGHLIALIGRSGSGKSTVALLLESLFAPTEGTIRIDGLDFAAWDPKCLRQRVSVVRSEPVLLVSSIRDNIALADPLAPLERVVAAAKLAGAHDFIRALPKGYESVVGPAGMRLSTGQSQAICVARALLNEPRLLILDDALSSLDLETERMLVRNLRATARDRTTILTSRCPLPAVYTDFIVVIDNGEVVEMGTHQELISQKGLYYFWTRD